MKSSPKSVFVRVWPIFHYGILTWITVYAVLIFTDVLQPDWFDQGWFMLLWVIEVLLSDRVQAKLSHLKEKYQIVVDLKAEQIVAPLLDAIRTEARK